MTAKKKVELPGVKLQMTPPPVDVRFELKGCGFGNVTLWADKGGEDEIAIAVMEINVDGEFYIYPVASEIGLESDDDGYPVITRM